MPFRPLPDDTGLLWQPETGRRRPRKHPCPDCFACQWCSDDRCRACRRPPVSRPTLPPADDDTRTR